MNIPDDEIWVKIGGDHGRDYFKLCLQILNVDKPNSQNNTCALLCVEGRDSRDNLETLLNPMSLQISQLCNENWQGKRIVVFLCGDYDFLSKLYGISGARGTYCCLWCDIPTKDIQLRAAECEISHDRSISDLKGTGNYMNSKFLPFVIFNIKP